MYRDKITKVLYKDKVRNKVLDRILKREDIDNSDLFDFLKLLVSKKQNHKSTKEFNAIIVEDWRKIVKWCKRKSISSVFSKRTYVVYKLVAENERFMNILILF